MKKVILGATAFIVGGVAFAQDSGQMMPENYLGGPQETVVNKSSNTDANAAETYQLGNNNKVRVAQAGTLQTAYVSQDNGATGEGANLAIIQQTGEVGPNSGVANAAEIKQSGATNGVAIGQQGDNNSARAYQGNGDFNAGTGDKESTGNISLIQQGTGQQAQYNAAETLQDGDENYVQIQQTFDRNSALVEQFGDRNKMNIDQNAGPNLSDGHGAIGQQVGDDNEGTIFQDGTAQNNGDTGASFARLLQLGNENKSKQIQTSIANEGTQGELGEVNQGFVDANALRNRLDNDGQANAHGTTNVLDQLNEVDNANDLTSNPFNNGSTGAEAVQMQTGKMNAGVINQFNGSVEAANRAQQNQSGWNQEALIVQDGTGSEGNFAFQDQSNDNNVAAIGQRGGGNIAQQVLDGKRNQAFSSQVGDNHKLSTNQSGNDSRFETLQNGVGNAIVIAQTDGQSAWVEQNRGEAGAGGNQAGIIQTGPNESLPGDLGVEVLNCDFQDIMEPAAFNAETLNINNLCPDCN